jgi:FtsH-binding integral membrane protein
MATIAARPTGSASAARTVPDLRYEHFFFSGMSILMLTTVFFGFARSYYLAGIFRAPLPSLIIHIHGAAFTCWILLLITQTSLVASGHTNIHQKLGIAGFLLGCLMVVLGPLAATDSLVRGAGPVGRDIKAFYIVPLTDILIFATLLFFAFRARRDSPSHKRLIYIATTSLLIAAVARLPFSFSHRLHPQSEVLTWIFLLFLVGYDLWSARKIHRVTLWASAFLIFVQLIRFPVGKTAAWHAFATWVQTHAR